MSEGNADTLVLVTGASGFLGSHCVRLLLQEGYKVRGTVRSLANKSKCDPVLAIAAGKNATDRLELVEADLLKPETWPDTMKDVDYVLHVASPFPLVSDAATIQTACDGTLNVLKAAADAENVKKVVLTSSCTACNEGHYEDRAFTEKDWSDLDASNISYYVKSKTLAERAAWDFLEGRKKDGKRVPALSTILPTLILGPVMIDEQGASITIIRRFMNVFEMPALPKMQLGCVDVRDVAKAHVEAMRRPETDGERFLVSAQPSLWFKDIADTLADEFRGQGYRIPRLQVPYPVVWIYSWIDAQAAEALPRLGKRIVFDCSRAEKKLGIEFRCPRRAAIAMAHSLIERGIVPQTGKYKKPKLEE